jgi:hypothetical protein
MNNKPLTPEEVQVAAEQFFPLFEIVRNSMPESATIEDTLKVMETVCGLAHKLRAEEEKIKFGFNKNETNTESATVG